MTNPNVSIKARNLFYNSFLALRPILFYVTVRLASQIETFMKGPKICPFAIVVQIPLGLGILVRIYRAGSVGAFVAVPFKLHGKYFVVKFTTLPFDLLTNSPKWPFWPI